MAWTFPAGNVVWKPEDIIALICQPGFMSPDDWRPVTFCAIVLAESGGDPLAINVNWNPGNPYHLSLDLGMFQLNSKDNIDNPPYPDVPKITAQVALDPQPAWAHTFKLLNKNKPGWNYNYSPWSAYNGGSYDKRVPDALTGMKKYRATSVPPLPPGPFGV